MSENKQSLECGLCPHKCILQPGRTGFCGTRRNFDGEIRSVSYGQVTSLAVDPIEKKPLYHFHPGTAILSVGGFGCNMKCSFCQNYGISQQGMEVSQGYVSPEDLVKLSQKAAAEAGSIGVAFTYNEPLLSYEYLLDTAPLLQDKGQKVVLVTNGQIMEEKFKKLLPYIDAMNIDLKAFSPEGYQWLGGDFATTQRTVGMAVEAGIHVEITSLIIPEFNDDTAMMEAEARWLCNIHPGMPLHLSRYFPRYKLNRPATPIETLYQLRTIAEKYLKYVYLGNV